MREHLERLILRPSYDDDIMQSIQCCANAGLVPNSVYVFSDDTGKVCNRKIYSNRVHLRSLLTNFRSLSCMQWASAELKTYNPDKGPRPFLLRSHDGVETWVSILIVLLL